MSVTFPVPTQSQEFQHAALDVLGKHPSAQTLIKKFSDATGVGHFLDGHSGRLQSVSDVVTGDDSFQCKVTVAEYSELNKDFFGGGAAQTYPVTVRGAVLAGIQAALGNVRPAEPVVIFE